MTGTVKALRNMYDNLISTSEFLNKESRSMTESQIFGNTLFTSRSYLRQNTGYKKYENTDTARRDIFKL